MTHVRFHFNVPDRTDYACRLVRKATRQGARVVISGPAATLAALDRVLWTFDPTEFVPHVLLSPGQPLPQRLAETPVCLTVHPADAPSREVLVNLGEDMPQGFEAFDRIVEIVSVAEEDRQAARLRWRGYERMGLTIERHEVVQ